MKRLYEYDDPYKVLAYFIVGHYRPVDIERVLIDDDYLYSNIQKEVRGLDIGGPYLDCIISEIYSHSQSSDYRAQLKKLATYYYQNLDINRLRQELISIIGDIVNNHSSGGNDSSQST